jgi:exopolysaccharide biosynthesis protein
MIPEFIVKQKTHIIYGIILLIILGVGYNLLSSKPKEIIKTLTVTKEVVKNVVQTRTQFIDRKIEVKSKDGTDTITTEHIVNDSNTVSKTKLDETISKKEVEKFLSKYSLTVL